jgi:predicted RNA-binding protein with PIN domain
VPVLIDGHNLIGRLPALSLQDPDDEEKLVRLLTSYRARTGKAVTVVFDPGEAFHLAQTRRLGGIEVVFAPHGSSADAVIARRVGSSRNPPDWLVVTSDQRLAETVKRQGARVQSAEGFGSALDRPVEAPPAWRETPPSSEEVEAWLALFESKEQQDTGE